MSELRIETLRVPGADLGAANPLPSLRPRGDLHAVPHMPGIPEEMRANMTRGRVSGVLPYTLQDGYGRELTEREFRAVVLENDVLRALFVPELGGRLWSLRHKPSGRELLDANPVFQAANLAIRNAWFSGGVEWNIGITGHSPFTCSPLFAARVSGPAGSPILRLYEWERIRGAPFQIDAWLPEKWPVLLVRVRIRNPHDHELPMYWWSNIAVPGTADTRVLVPADSAYSFGYGDGGLQVVSIPNWNGADVSYPANLPRSGDFFYRMPAAGRPWITALDSTGSGLIQTSTQRLRGRKLFFWGHGPGGKRWQEFLARPGSRYMELQAGLAPTQMEYVAMPAHADWEWLEAYGLLEAEPDSVHGDDWNGARACAEAALERLMPERELAAALDRSREFRETPPAAMIQTGSGWGTLERHRRIRDKLPPFAGAALPFPDSTLGVSQKPWLTLLRTDAFPAATTDTEPSGWLVQEPWRLRLERAVTGPSRDNWLAWLHLGVMRCHAGDPEGARSAWERSRTLADTPWSLRNLAVLARQEDRLETAAALYLAAARKRPDLRPLAVECASFLVDAGRYRECLVFVLELPPELRASGRIRLLTGRAELGAGNLDAVARLLEGEPIVVADLREREQSLSDLWFQYHEARIRLLDRAVDPDELRERVRREFPVPPALDFRMSTPAVEGEARAARDSGKA